MDEIPHSPQTNCPLGCNHQDSLEHLYGDCPPVWQNVNTIRKNFDLPPIPRADRKIATMIGATKPLSRKEATLNLFLLFTIWSARSTLLRNTTLLLPAFFSVTITGLMAKYCPAILKSSSLQQAASHLSFLNPSTGKSGTRTKEQKRQAKAEAERLISSFPSNATVAFTDGGTHLSNPGPCGSGIYIPGPPNSPPTNIIIPLGWGTNNLGEIAAIGAAIEYIISNNPPPSSEIHILTDSHLSYGILQLYWRSKHYPAIANHIRRLIDSTSNINPITIHWIAGHAGIQGNNAADANASAAAKVSANTACHSPQFDERTIILSWRRRLNLPDD